MFPSLYRYRSLIWQHAVADLRLRYAGSGMGAIWNVAHPLAMLAVYSVVFTALMGAEIPGWPGGRLAFFLYLCLGLLVWTAFSECLTRTCAAFTTNAPYLKKLPIPEQVFVAQAALSATLGGAISFSILLAAALAVPGVRPHLTWLLIPVPLILLQITGFGIGLTLGSLNVFFPDVGQLLTVALQVLFWLTPVVYLRDRLPNWVQPPISFHPATPVIESVRDVFLGQSIDLTHWLAMLAWTTAAAVTGALTLRALRAEIRDVL